MRLLRIGIIVVGMVFLLSGIVAAAWAASQANAMSGEDRALDPGQYDFYISAQSCSLGSVFIGMIVVAIGVFIGRRTVAIAKKGKRKEPNEGGLEP